MTTSAAATGTLKIGDQWNAITIIAHSQTHPLKAICEFTENAIDAGAAHVRITRRRSAGKTYLEVADDGRGVAADAEGVPDFGRIATHLCDSMKRQLTANQRRGVHGEFGIGLLSFWSLGEELRIDGFGRGPVGEGDAGSGADGGLTQIAAEEILDRRHLPAEHLQERLLDHRQAHLGGHRLALRIGGRDGHFDLLARPDWALGIPLALHGNAHAQIALHRKRTGSRMKPPEGFLVLGPLFQRRLLKKSCVITTDGARY